MTYNIIKEIREQTGVNYKKRVLLKYKDNKDFKTILYYTYNKNFNYYITKIPVYESSFDGRASLDDMFTTLDALRSGEYRGHSGITLLSRILGLLSPGDSEILKLIIGRDIKAGVNTKTINKVYGDLIPITHYMRCSKLEEKTIKNISYPSILQKKSDGLFCYAIKEDGRARFCTRNGSQFTFDKLAKELEGIEEDNFVISGELLVFENRRELDRKTGNGLINSFIKKESTLDKLVNKPIKHKEKEQEFNSTESKLELEAWDMITIDEYYAGVSTLPYENRFYNYLRDITDIISSINSIETYIVYSIEEAKDKAQNFIKKGYEGAILKDRKSIWKDGTSRDNLKIKQIQDADLMCIGVEEGTGKNEGKVGSLILESSCTQLKVNVGTGLSDEDRAKPFDYYIGKVIEVQYNELITSKGKDTSSLFLPVFVEVREDKDTYNSLGELK